MLKVFWIVLIYMVAGLCAGAEVYPARGVRVIVPAASNSTGDFVARVISPQLAKQLGKSFTVDNRANAGGALGTDLAAKSRPDGYTLLLIDTSTALLPALQKSLPFDVARDFTPITQLTATANVLVVPAAFKANTLKEFIALAHASPGKLNYSSTGVGSANHLWAALFIRAQNLTLTHVPFKNAGDALSALLGDDAQMQVTEIPTVLAFVTNGKLRALAVTSADRKRSPALPNVPSMSEAGVPGMTIYAWHGLAGPAGLPKEIAARLHAEAVKALAVAAVKENYLQQCVEIVGSTPEEFTAHVNSELVRLREVVRVTGVAPK